MSENNLPLFTERLKKLYTSRKVLHKDVLAATGIKERTLRRYETGEREPPMSALIALSKFFGVSVDYLVGLTDDPSHR